MFWFSVAFFGRQSRTLVPLISCMRQPWIKEAVSGGRRYCRGLPDFFHYRFGTFHHLVGWSAVRIIILFASIIPQLLSSFFFASIFQLRGGNDADGVLSSG
ncbi:hypothetical protein NPIL_350941 [Nephila pilipes]|uniref:Uncharacterized protein n=1 Tax=Nephila pilipes TaxID=299642 RepID=A0A8X6IWY7_NEPPI|nr:hypothetical protein NPIL_350941 [Nephila pilipes]